MRKKVLSVLLCTAMAATMLTGCGGSADDTNKGTDNNATSGASSATSEKPFRKAPFSSAFSAELLY